MKDRILRQEARVRRLVSTLRVSYPIPESDLNEVYTLEESHHADAY